MTMFNIHIFKFEIVFKLQQLVEQQLFKVNSLDVEQHYHAVEVAFEAHVVVAVPRHVVNVYFLLDYVLWRAHFGDQVQSNVFESKVAGKIQRNSSLFISFTEQIQNIGLRLHSFGGIGWIVLFLVKSLNDISQMAIKDLVENSLAPGELYSLQGDSFVDPLLGTLLGCVHFEIQKFQIFYFIND